MDGGMDMSGMGMPSSGMGAPPTITTTPADTFMNNAFNWRPDLTAWNKIANFPNLDMSAIQAANSIGAARQNANFAPWLPGFKDAAGTRVAWAARLVGVARPPLARRRRSTR
jgi:hypothetical protein